MNTSSSKTSDFFIDMIKKEIPLLDVKKLPKGFSEAIDIWKIAFPLNKSPLYLHNNPLP
jgi:hypothetical protein